MKKVKKLGPKKITVLYPLTNTEAKRPEKKIRVAAYCRVSTSSEEQMESYNAQIRHYETYIKGNESFSLAGIYADQGISGTSTKNRDAFNRMIEDAKEGKIDRIITKSISRFGRNTVDTLKAIRGLRELDIDIHFEKENIHTLDGSGELLITLLSAIAQQESIVQGENVAWGKRRKFEKGDIGSIPWKNLTGYDKNKKGEVIVIENEAAMVRRLFDAFIQGYGTKEIARRLNGSTTDGKWSCRQIIGMLENEKYKGDIRFQLSVTVDPLTKKQIKNTGQLPQYYVENSHPAIVSKETWEIANLEMARQREFCQDHHMTMYHCPNEKVEPLPLTGRIICHKCSHTFKVKLSNSTFDKGRRYYTCKQHRTGYRREVKPDNCRNGTRLFVEEAHQAFVNAWNLLVDHPGVIIESEDTLKLYRVKELRQLLEIGKINQIEADIVRRTLDHITVGEDGVIEVLFLSGTKVNI
jgi:DNA invertase Pin-like site-specific DNA recombinase